MLRQVIHIAKIFQVNLLGIRLILEVKILRCDLISSLPVSELNTVLRSIGYALGGNDISARIGTLTVGDPDLPIDFLGSKSEVIAFNARRSYRCQGLLCR